jgi:uncharacterized ferritin-like protein (DUF455 family)
VALVDPRKTASGKNVKALVHSLVHAESYAMDLSWDMVARFGWAPHLWGRPEWLPPTHAAAGAGAGCLAADTMASADTAFPSLPMEPVAPAGRASTAAEGPAARLPDAFFAHWVKVAADEARHFASWHGFLVTLGCRYGALPCHDGLWQSAAETSDSLAARLSIVHCVHEGRGLDTAVAARAKFERAGLPAAVAILDRNHADETTHVAAGCRWLRWLVRWWGTREGGVSDDAGSAVAVFRAVVAQRFHGTIRPPFNVPSREKATMGPEWYTDLAGRGGGGAAAGAGE